MYLGHVVVLPANMTGRTRRRVFDLRALARESGTAVHTVTICDLSTEGCRILGSPLLAPARDVWIKLRGHLAVQAEIAWATDGEAECRFVTPLTKGSMEELFEQCRQSIRKLKGRFGRARRRKLNAGH